MVPNPAHSGCESWLQSVWAVGRHLSQSSSAVDAFAAPGTCKQLTPQITVVWVVHGGADNSPAQPALAHAAGTMSSTPINTISKRVRGYKELPSSRGSMPRADVVENQLSSAIHSRLPTSNTSRARPKVLYSTVNENSSCPTAQVVGRNLLWYPKIAQCEIALMWERVYPRVETCKQSLRGAVLVQSTYV